MSGSLRSTKNGNVNALCSGSHKGVVCLLFLFSMTAILIFKRGQRLQGKP